MYLEKIHIKGYRVFNQEFIVTLNNGLNVLVGENASGKSTVIDAIRLILLEDEYGRNGVSETDFHRPMNQPSKTKGVNQINIRCEFDDLSSDEQIAYLPWLDLRMPRKAILNLVIENKEDERGRFKRKIWGNESVSGLFEWELLSCISCIYLPPLRDAQEKLKAYKGSRLSRLLKNLRTDNENEDQHPLERKFAALNRDLLRDDSILNANKFIKDNILKSVGQVFGQDVSLQFSEINFDRIVERIRLLFHPQLPKTGEITRLDMFRELNENSLGFNNILYLATILAEFDGKINSGTFHKILLIEEPEAHLHPQLQIRLMQYLQEKASESQIQIIVTTHSPTLACSVDLNSVKIMSLAGETLTPVYTNISHCCIPQKSKNFLERWLDITKSTLLFARGVLLVEGIAEALILREISKIVLKNLSEEQDKVFYGDLQEYGISIINLNGIYFDHFLSLFKGYKKNTEGNFEKCAGIPIRCVGITDNDPPKESKPHIDNLVDGENHQLYLIEELQLNSENCRLFKNLKTFEYDLALEENNLSVMLDVFADMIITHGPIKKKLVDNKDTNWKEKSPNEKAEMALWLLDKIDKGEYAQALSQKLSESDIYFAVPKYITDAIKWLLR